MLKEVRDAVRNREKVLVFGSFKGRVDRAVSCADYGEGSRMLFGKNKNGKPVLWIL
jgi:hypothetical protein